MVGQRIADEFNARQSRAAQAREDYYLALRDAGWTYQAIAEAEGISKQRVSQLVARAKKRRLQQPVL